MPDALDPDDPIVRLVRQARALGDGRIRLIRGETPEVCTDCWHNTRIPVFAHSRAVSTEYAIRIGSHCPICQTEPKEDSWQTPTRSSGPSTGPRSTPTIQGEMVE